jgi:hypothetical protein
MAFDLTSIAKTGQSSLPPRIVLHGPQGIGKTTFCASMDAPVFIPTEDGLAGVDVQAFPLATELSQVKEALASLAKSDFKTIVIDSADWLEALIHKQVCKEHSKENIESFGYGKGYTLALQHWRELLRILDWYRVERGMAVVLIAHSEIRRFDSPDTESYDRYGVKLHKTASALMVEWADIVAFANWLVMTSETDTGFGSKRVRGHGNGQRVLHLEERPSHIAKSRYPLPAQIALDWTELSNQLNKNKEA